MRIDGSECKVNHGVHNPRRGYFWSAWSRIIIVALFASSSLHGYRRESGVDDGARGQGKSDEDDEIQESDEEEKASGARKTEYLQIPRGKSD